MAMTSSPEEVVGELCENIRGRIGEIEDEIARLENALDALDGTDAPVAKVPRISDEVQKIMSTLAG